eukprot:6179620-Pleurochrysis_carterae.AAC.4
MPMNAQARENADALMRVPPRWCVQICEGYWVVLEPRVKAEEGMQPLAQRRAELHPANEDFGDERGEGAQLVGLVEEEPREAERHRVEAVD